MTLPSSSLAATTALLALTLTSASRAGTQPDLAEAYNVPGRTGKAPGVVMLCPSADGSYTAQACSNATSTVGGNVSLAPGSNVIGGVSQAPTASAAFALTAVSSAVPESSHVLKAASGNLYGFSVIAGASAGYVLVLDTATVPADGPVAPKKCYPLPATGVLAASWQPGPPVAFVNGITVVFSSSGCFSKTAQTAAFISGEVQ
jgi:hypothetical protein